MLKRFFTMGAALLALLVLLASCAPQEDDAAEAEDTQETEYRVGIAFDVGGRGDRSFNDSAYRGLVRIAEEYNGYIAGDPDDVDFGNRIELRYLEPQQGGQDREQLLRIMAEDGYDLLFGVGFAYTDSLQTVAEEFPNVHFGLVDGFVEGLTDESNITSISFAEHEGSFLVGALAGWFLADNMPGARLGFIGGTDTPLIHKFHGGYFAGAMYANPQLRADDVLMGQYIGQDPSAFNDPATAENIARNMYDRNAFVIYHAAGASGTGLFQAALDEDRWAIGVDSDQGAVFAESDSEQEQRIAEQILTSMLKRVDTSVFDIASDLIDDGEVNGGYRTYGLEDNGVAVAVNQYNEEILSPYLDRLEELQQMVVNGEIAVPDHDNQLEDWMAETF